MKAHWITACIFSFSVCLGGECSAGDSDDIEVIMKVGVESEGEDVGAFDQSLEVTMMNNGAIGVVLWLGEVLNNGREFHHSNLIVSLLGGNGEEALFEVLGPPVVAGRMDPYLVGLPVCSEYRFRIKIYEILGKHSFEKLSSIRSGIYDLSVILVCDPDKMIERDVDSMAWWSGSIRSQSIRVSIDDGWINVESGGD